MDDSNVPLVRQLTEHIRRMTVMMQPEGPEDWPEVELTMPQLRALIFLSQGAGRMSDIADYLDASHSSTTSIVDRLVDKQLVTRAHDTHDRRVIICSLSEQGQHEVKNLWQISQARFEAVTAYLTADQLETVVASLGLLADAMEQHARVVRTNRTGALRTPASHRGTASSCGLARK